MKKRGLSDVVTTVLIILLAIAAIAVIWIFLNRFLLDSTSQLTSEELATRLSIPNGAKVTIDPVLKKVGFIVKKDSGDAEVAGLNVVLKDSSGISIVKKASLSLNTFEIKNLEVFYSELKDISSISISPIFKRDNGKELISSQQNTKVLSASGAGDANSIPLMNKEAFSGTGNINIQYVSPLELAGYWGFDSISTADSITTTPDYSINSNSGILKSYPSNTALPALLPENSCKVGKCLQFDINSKQYVDVSPSFAFKITTEGTITFWANPSTNNIGLTDVFAKNGADWAHNDYSVHYSNGRFFGNLGSGSGSLNYGGPRTPVISAGSWYFITFTWDTNAHTAKIYLNGVLSQTVSTSLIPEDVQSGLNIGRDYNYNAYYFPGKIDEFMIFNRALSDSEVNALYSSQK